MKIILVTHPIQYYNPWFEKLSEVDDILVLFMSGQKGKATYDKGFSRKILWDNIKFNFPHKFIRNYALSKDINNFFGLINIQTCIEIFKNKPSHVIFFGYRNFSFLLAMIFCKILGVKVVVRGDSHQLDGYLGSRAKKKIRDFVVSCIYRLVDYGFYVGQANKQYFLTNGIDEDKLFLIEHFVDESFFLATDVPAKQEDDPLNIYFVGKFEEKKNPQIILEAIKLLECMGADLHRLNFHFVGSGELEMELCRLARDTKALIQFHGFKNQSELKKIYLNVDVLILPSIYNETWGLVVNEAMLGGSCIITSDKVGCAKDLVIEGVTGYVFESGDVRALAEHFSNLSKMSWHDLEKIKLQSLEHAKNFTVLNAVKKWVEFFK